MDDGFAVAAGFFALGLLWVFLASMFFGFIDFVRRFLG